MDVYECEIRTRDFQEDLEASVWKVLEKEKEKEEARGGERNGADNTQKGEASSLRGASRCSSNQLWCQRLTIIRHGSIEALFYAWETLPTAPGVRPDALSPCKKRNTLHT